jgi:hypothetical protein
MLSTSLLRVRRQLCTRWLVARLRSEVKILQDANKALSKRRRAKKTRVQNRGTLTIGDAQDLLAQKAQPDTFYPPLKPHFLSPAPRRCCLHHRPYGIFISYVWELTPTARTIQPRDPNRNPSALLAAVRATVVFL